MLYIINYTLRGNIVDYSNLYSKIKELGDSYHQATETLWFVHSDNPITVENVVESIRPHLGKSDLLFVCGLPINASKDGILSKLAWDFIKSCEAGNLTQLKTLNKTI